MRTMRGGAAAIAAIAAVVGAASAGPAGAAVGDRDTAFNGGQQRQVHVPADVTPANPDHQVATGMTIDGAGRTLVALSVEQQTSPTAQAEFAALGRLAPDGATDTGFGTNGFAFARQYAGATAMDGGGVGVDPLGRLTAAFPDGGRLIAGRYVDSGRLDGDSGYGDGGVATATLPSSGYDAQTAIVGPDGAAYYVAHDTIFNTGSETAIRIAKVKPDGTDDTAYSAGGPFVVRRDVIGSDVRDVADVDGQGRLVVARTYPDPNGSGVRIAAVMRFTADGRLDTTFDGDGIKEIVPLYGLLVRSVDVSPSGEIVVAGTRATPAPGSFFFVVGPEGQLRGPTVVPPVPDGVIAAFQPDGKIVAVGKTTSRSGTSLELLRYLPDGTPDPSFSEDGRVTDDFAFAGKPTVAAIARGKVTVALQTTSSSSVASVALLRYVLQDPSLAPEATTLPTIAGTPAPGQVLTCGEATWTNTPTVEVVWERAPRSTTGTDDPAWGPLGASGRQYTVTAQDLGSRVRCREVATNANGSGSAPSPSLRVDDGVPVNQQAPDVTGTPVIGQTLRCDPGIWSGGPDLTVRWLRDGQVIPGADGRQYTLQLADRRARVTCEVGARNDVGPAAAPAKARTTLFAVYAPPAILDAPPVARATTGPKPTDLLLTCGPGRWDEDYGQYDFRWEREGAEIAGATSSSYAATVADLGRNLRCVVFSTNPAGRSDGARSADVLVPLPATGEPGAIYTAGAFNRLDPANFLAVTKAWKDRIRQLVLQRKRAAADAARQACTDAPLPDPAKFKVNTLMSAADTCGVLRRAPAEQLNFDAGGIQWENGSCLASGGPGTEPRGSGVTCPSLRVTVPALRATSPPSDITSIEQAALEDVKPVRVLWDFDQDGRTDASCDPDAPILRTLPSTGIYKIRAVIISADSEQTGLYSVTDLDYRFHPSSEGDRGEVRGAQPFVCKTSLLPPEEPSQPCATEATVGRTHVVGNICPVSARRIPEEDLGGLPPDVQRVLEQQALDGPLRTAPAAPPAQEASFGLRAAPGSLPFIATRQVSALATFGNLTGAAKVPSPWLSALKTVPGFKEEAAQFAMDQIYLIKGQAKINGVDFDPRNGALTVMVPSDAGKAIESVKKMTLSNRDVATTLGGIPIGDPGRLATDLTDSAKAAIAPTLRQANLDALRKDLLKKLDLGPFKLAGDANLRMADDGTAFIDAQAELKGPFKAGSGPIRTKVTVRATREGRLSLEGVHLEVPKALLGAVSVSGLKLDYDGGGLSIQGKLLFPPVNDGVAINRFRVDGGGNFKELDVSYLAGAGQGINIGPGIFLVKLGGGLSMDPDEIRARAGISMGPSAGGGCPTAGLDADMNVHFGPGPFFVQARSEVQLLCIPVGNANFYADSTGLADIDANVAMDLGLIYFDARLHGGIKLPNWQLDARGKGGIRHLLKGEVKALLGNLGIAACGRVEVFPETPFTDSVTIAGGAGVRFSGGRPPLSYPELIGNLRVFDGCNLSRWSPFGRDVRAVTAQAGGERAFTLGQNAPKVLALQLTGAGGAPRVTVTTPKGEVLDATGLGEDLTTSPQLSGLTDPGHDRTVLFLRGAPGTWKVTPADGSPGIADLERATLLPAVRVRGGVGGAGASRVLRWDVAKVPGQVVRFVETSDRGRRPIATVKGGGKGSARFVTSEGRGTARTITADVEQDGLPRDRVVVARFRAPAPAAAKPKVALRRRGSTVTATWPAAVFAARYEAEVRTGRGRRFLATPSAAKRTLKVGGIAQGEAVEVRLRGVTAGGRRGPAAVVRTSGLLRKRTTPATRWSRRRR